MARNEALRNHVSEIAPEHALVAVARDAMTPWPETAEPAAGRQARLPLTEDPSLSRRVLAELGITPDALAVETCRVAGLAAPGRLSERGPDTEADGAPTTVGAAMTVAVSLSLAWARGLRDNHVSTLHQLFGISAARGAPHAREALANLGVSSPRAIKRTAGVVADQRDEMRRQMLVLALENDRLRRSLAEMFPGSTRGLRWRRKRLLSATQPAEQTE